MISLDRDVQFQSRAELESRAYYLALGGIDFYRFNVVRPAVNTYGPVAVGEGGYFEVTGDPDGTVRSRGYITNLNGTVLAEKRLVAPQGSTIGAYAP